MQREVQLSHSVDDKGTTRREQLEGLRATHGAAALNTEDTSLLEPIEIPRTARWVYETFWRLGQRRGYGEMSGTPHLLSWQEIDAYARLHQLTFSGFDVEAIEAMDNTFVGAQLELKRGASHE